MYVFALIKFGCIRPNHRLPIETGCQQNLQGEGRKCMKRNLSVVVEEFSFLFGFFAYIDYCTKFVPRKFVQPPLTFIFCRIMSYTKIFFVALSKFVREAKYYLTPQTTTIDCYHCKDILLV